MICGMTLYQLFSYFLIYSFLGWVVEVVFHVVTLGQVINRGFLNGPVCPIYGFGVVSVFALINTLESAGMPMTAMWVFVFGLVLATLVELLGGWLMDICFHARWWDYSDRPLNLNGYICAEFSLIWGLAILMVVRIFQKTVEAQPFFFSPSRLRWVIILVLLVLYAADFGVTVGILCGFNRRLKRLDEVRTEMRAVSDRLSEMVGNPTLSAAQKIGEERVQVSLAKAELRDFVAEKKVVSEKELLARQEALRIRFEELSNSITAHHLFGFGHLLKAFPKMKHRNYSELIGQLKDRIK